MYIYRSKYLDVELSPPGTINTQRLDVTDKKVLLSHITCMVRSVYKCDYNRCEPFH